MAILHKNITASADIHNPKWHPDANNGDYAWRNEKGQLESLDELLLPAALNFVDGSVAPPTSNNNDIYVLSSGASVNAGWGSVSLQDWVRYDGSVWYAITPQKSSLCYDKTADSLMSFNGTAWAAIGSGGGGGGNTIYTADDTIGSGRVATITDTLTFAGGKLVLSSTNDGILLNRVDDSQMAAISATTNEIVFNTQQEGLFRWDGSDWVSLASGYGIVGTTDATGKPTFYATVKAAYISGNGSVKLYSDITETSANTIDIVDGRDIDLNGFSYIYDVADSSDVFEATTANNTFRIINGRVIRKNGTAGSYIFNTNNAQTQIDFINIYAENESTTGTNLRTAGTFNAVGSTFVCNNTTGAGVYFNVGSKVTGGKYIQKVNGDNTTLGDELNNVQLICEGSGKSNIRGIVKNSFFVANSGRAIATTALTKIYNSYMYSTSSNAIDLRNGSEVHNSVIISNSSTALGGTAGTETRVVNSTIITESSTGASPVNCPKYLQGCDVISNGNATAIVFPNGQSNAIVSDCRITLTNGASKYGILTNNTSSGIVITNNKIFVNASSNQGIRILSDAYIANNTIKGTSTAINLGANSNLWTASIDSEGNSAQL